MFLRHKSKIGSRRYVQFTSDCEYINNSINNSEQYEDWSDFDSDGVFGQSETERELFEEADYFESVYDLMADSHINKNKNKNKKDKNDEDNDEGKKKKKKKKNKETLDSEGEKENPETQKEDDEGGKKKKKKRKSVQIVNTEEDSEHQNISKDNGKRRKSRRESKVDSDLETSPEGKTDAKMIFDEGGKKKKKGKKKKDKGENDAELFDAVAPDSSDSAFAEDAKKSKKDKKKKGKEKKKKVKKDGDAALGIDDVLMLELSDSSSAEEGKKTKKEKRKKEKKDEDDKSLCSDTHRPSVININVFNGRDAEVDRQSVSCRNDKGEDKNSKFKSRASDVESTDLKLDRFNDIELLDSVDPTTTEPSTHDHSFATEDEATSEFNEKAPKAITFNDKTFVKEINDDSYMYSDDSERNRASRGSITRSDMKKEDEERRSRTNGSVISESDERRSMTHDNNEALTNKFADDDGRGKRQSHEDDERRSRVSENGERRSRTSENGERRSRTSENDERRSRVSENGERRSRMSENDERRSRMSENDERRSRIGENDERRSWVREDDERRRTMSRGNDEQNLIYAKNRKINEDDERRRSDDRRSMRMMYEDELRRLSQPRDDRGHSSMPRDDYRDSAMVASNEKRGSTTSWSDDRRSMKHENDVYLKGFAPQMGSEQMRYNDERKRHDSVPPAFYRNEKRNSAVQTDREIREMQMQTSTNNRRDTATQSETGFPTGGGTIQDERLRQMNNVDHHSQQMSLHPSLAQSPVDAAHAAASSPRWSRRTKPPAAGLADAMAWDDHGGYRDARVSVPEVADHIDQLRESNVAMYDVALTQNGENSHVAASRLNSIHERNLSYGLGRTDPVRSSMNGSIHDTMNNIPQSGYFSERGSVSGVPKKTNSVINAMNTVKQTVSDTYLQGRSFCGRFNMFLRTNSYCLAIIFILICALYVCGTTPHTQSLSKQRRVNKPPPPSPKQTKQKRPLKEATIHTKQETQDTEAKQEIIKEATIHTKPETKDTVAKQEMKAEIEEALSRHASGLDKIIEKRLCAFQKSKDAEFKKLREDLLRRDEGTAKREEERTMRQADMMQLEKERAWAEEDAIMKMEEERAKRTNRYRRREAENQMYYDEPLPHSNEDCMHYDHHTPQHETHTPHTKTAPQSSNTYQSRTNMDSDTGGPDKFEFRWEEFARRSDELARHRKQTASATGQGPAHAAPSSQQGQGGFHGKSGGAGNPSRSREPFCQPSSHIRCPGF